MAGAAQHGAIGRDLRWLSRLRVVSRRPRRSQAARDRGPRRAVAARRRRGAGHGAEQPRPAPHARPRARALRRPRRAGHRHGAPARSVEVLSHALNNVGSARVHAGDLSGRRLQEESLALALDHDLHEHAARAFTNLSAAASTRATTSTRGDGSTPASTTRSSATRFVVATTCSPGGRVCSPRPAAGRRPRRMRRTVIGNVRDHGRRQDTRADGARPVSGAAAGPGAASCWTKRSRSPCRTAEKQRLVPVRAARAELALLQGRPEAARAEAERDSRCSPDRPVLGVGLSLLKWRADGGRRAPCRAGTDWPAPRPPRPQHARRVAAAADAWERSGCPYERAEALADGDVPAMEEALQAFWRGRRAGRRSGSPGPAARGVTRLRRGPRPSTRAHPAGLTRAKRKSSRSSRGI